MKTDERSRDPMRRGGGRVCRIGQDVQVLIHKRCLLQGECFHCAFDQWLEAFDETEGSGRVGKAA